MKNALSLKYYGITLLIIVILVSVISFIEMYSCWSGKPISISQFENIDLTNYNTTDKIVTTVYLILDITLLIPAIWFYKICNKIAKRDFYNEEIISYFKNIGTSLFLLSIIPLFLVRLLNTSDNFIKPEFWFNIHPFFFMFIATLFETFAFILKEGLKHKQENELTI